MIIDMYVLYGLSIGWFNLNGYVWLGWILCYAMLCYVQMP